MSNRKSKIEATAEATAIPTKPRAYAPLYARQVALEERLVSTDSALKRVLISVFHVGVGCGQSVRASMQRKPSAKKTIQHAESVYYGAVAVSSASQSALVPLTEEQLLELANTEHPIVVGLGKLTRCGAHSKLMLIESGEIYPGWSPTAEKAFQSMQLTATLVNRTIVSLLRVTPEEAQAVVDSVKEATRQRHTEFWAKQKRQDLNQEIRAEVQETVAEAEAGGIPMPA